MKIIKKSIESLAVTMTMEAEKVQVIPRRVVNKEVTQNDKNNDDANKTIRTNSSETKARYIWNLSIHEDDMRNWSSSNRNEHVDG